MNGAKHFKLAVTSDLNAYCVLDTPLVYGDFIKTVYAQRFELPGSKQAEYEARCRLFAKVKDKKKWNLPGVKDYDLQRNNELGLNI